MLRKNIFLLMVVRLLTICSFTVSTTYAADDQLDGDSSAGDNHWDPVTALTNDDIEYFVGYRHRFYDNFFQAPLGSPETTINANEIYTGVETDICCGGNWSILGQVGYLDYSKGLEPSWSTKGKIEGKSGVHSTLISVQYRDNVPNANTGDGIRTANVYEVQGRYSYRLQKVWQLSVLGDYQQQHVQSSSNNQLYLLGVAVRYRGWGSIFSPEFGVKFGERLSGDVNNEHAQRDTWIKIVSAPSSSLYLSTRLRHRKRDYDTSSPLDSNFGRDDERWQLTIGGEYKFNKMFSMDLYYANQDANSSRASRTFDTSTLILGVKLRF